MLEDVSTSTTRSRFALPDAVPAPPEKERERHEQETSPIRVLGWLPPADVTFLASSFS